MTMQGTQGSLPGGQAARTVPCEVASDALLLDSVSAATLLGISRATFWKLHSTGKVPFPIRWGRLVRWRREELEAWVRAGCPGRENWQNKGCA